jgi:hypothetical protein
MVADESGAGKSAAKGVEEILVEWLRAKDYLPGDTANSIRGSDGRE